MKPTDVPATYIPRATVPTTNRVWGDREAEAAGLYEVSPTMKTPQPQNTAALPAGFELIPDEPAKGKGSTALPEGFSLIEEGEAKPTFNDRFAAVSDRQAFDDVKPSAPAKKPFGWQDTWPVQAAKSLYSAATLPGDVMAGRVHVPSSDGSVPGSVPYGSEGTTDFENRLRDLTLAANPANVAMRAGSGIFGVVPTAKQAASTIKAAVPEGVAVAEAGKRIGVDLPRAVTSDKAAVQQVGKIATAIPIGGTPLRNASRQAIEQLGKKADEVQTALGSGEANAAGAAAREGIERYIGKETADKADALYSKVDELVNPTATRPLVHTQQAVNTINGRRTLAAMGDSPAAANVAEALSRPEGLTYEGVKQLRTSVGEMLKGGQLPANISQSELKSIYGALSQDLKGTVLVAGGRRAAAMFDRANQYYNLVSARRENLSRILKTNSDEAAFGRIAAAAGSTARGDINLLSQAKKAMQPQEWNELASGVLVRIGRDAEGAFSPDRFVTGWGKLSDAGKGMLFTGEHRAALNDIAKVSSRFKQLNQYANPSGTGQTVAGVAGLGGAWVDPVSLVGSVVSARVLSGILAKPATAQSLARYTAAYERAAKMPREAGVKYLARETATFATQVARNLGVPQLAGELTQSLSNAAQPQR